MRKLTYIKSQSHTKLVEYVHTIHAEYDRLKKMSDKHYRQTIKLHRKVDAVRLERDELKKELDGWKKAHSLLISKVVAANKNNTAELNKATIALSKIILINP